MAKYFRTYNIDQPMLFAPDVREWLPERHLAYFISDIIEDMDLSEVYASYVSKSGRGASAIDPRLLLKLLIYGYCKGVRSSRRIEQATYEDIAFRVLACQEHPDHDTIASFRARHTKAFSKIFLSVLKLCQKSGLVKMGHVCLDGTKIRASANKTKSRNVGDLMKSDADLTKEIEAMLAEAEAVDHAEDKKYGKGKRGDELPDQLKDRVKRKKLIKELLEKIEKEAKEKKESYIAEKESKTSEDKAWEWDTGQKIERRPPNNPTNKPTEEIVTSRRNPTDYDSRVMKDGQSGGYIQAYNCQAVVDSKAQIIVATSVNSQTNDKQLAVPMIESAIKNTGMTPQFMSADNGYYSERDIVKLEKLGVDPYIPPTRNSQGKRLVRSGCSKLTVTSFMQEKLQSKTGSSIYRRRKTIIEPVFGQIKEAKKFRSFLLRGKEKAQGEWELMAACHNIMKLHSHKGR